MSVLDTNIFIYLADGSMSRLTIKDVNVMYASVTKIEAIGYWKISAAEKDYLEQLFDQCYQCSLNDTTIDLAIKLRLRKRMNLADAIIAATALESNEELWTANTKDFENIEGLKVTNPFSFKA